MMLTSMQKLLKLVNKSPESYYEELAYNVKNIHLLNKGTECLPHRHKSQGLQAVTSAVQSDVAAFLAALSTFLHVLCHSGHP